VERRIRDLEAEVLAQRQVQRDLERELKKFRGLYDLAIAMTSDQSTDDILQLIVDKCCELLQTDMSYITLHDESRGDLYKHTSAGIRTAAFQEMRLPPGMGLAGMVAEAGRGHMVENYLEETSLDAGLRSIIAAEGIVSGMAVPVSMASKKLGLLYVFNRKRTAFSQSDLETLSLIGNLAAVEISRKDAEESLRESEERFRFMAETTGDVIYRLRYDSMSYDYLSPGIKKLTGFSTQEINAVGFSKLVARIDLPHQENVQPQAIAQARQEGKVDEYRADYLITTRLGDKKWLRDHSFPWCDGTGRVVGSVGILSDVTEYKRAEALVRERTEELVASEEKFRTLVENVPLVVYRLRPEGEILFVNQFVEDLFGYTPVEILSNPALWSEVLYDRDRPRVTAQREKIYQGGQELITEYRVKHKQGHLVDVIDHAIPLRTPEGLISVVDGIIMDITWMVRLHEQLVRAEGLKTISEVSSRLAHEIRNPLVSAGGFARRLLSSMGVDDPNRPKVEIIVKEVARLEVILRMILNYLQPLELTLSPADLNVLVDTALKRLGGDFGRHRVGLDLEFEARLPVFAGDSKLLEQVLETLLTHALTQMPEGSILALRTAQVEEVLELMMRYPIAHFSADDAEHFFYPFTTTPVALEAIDLPLCKIIVNKHGGTISVALEAPKELVIRIALPFLDDRPKGVLAADK
jgi:PAS domain S-box-containing protein